jgi:hypothetical protein
MLYNSLTQRRMQAEAAPKGYGAWKSFLHSLGARERSGLAGKDPGVEGTGLLSTSAQAAEDVDAAVHAAAVVRDTKSVLNVRTLAAGAAGVADARDEARVADLLLVGAREAEGADPGHAARAAVTAATA